MDIKSYLAILNGKKWVILSTTIATILVTTLITFLITPIYTAWTTLRVATASSGVAGYSDYMYADRLMNTYTKIATSGPVLKELTNKLKLETVPQVKVETILNTELIRISVESSDPTIAQNSANTLAEILISKGKELYTGEGKSTQEILSDQLKQAEDELNRARRDYDALTTTNPNDSARIAAMREGIQLKEKTYATLLEQYDQARLREIIRANIISVVEPAFLPKVPSKPNKVMNIGLGFMIGLVGGIGLAFFFESIGSRLYTSKQIEMAAELNLLGKIPFVKRKNWFVKAERGDGLVINANFQEAFRQLQVKLFMLSPEKLGGRTIKTLLVTSSEPGEGKSTVAVNLARAISQSGKKVILVDCDLHIPKQHKMNGTPNEVGLSSILNEMDLLEGAVQCTQYPGMYVITSGPLIANPAKLFEAMKIEPFFTYLCKHFDVIILDTPAMLAVAETSLLATLVDGVLLVVRRNFTRAEAVREACKHLEYINANVIGLVVNDAELNGNYYYYRGR